MIRADCSSFVSTVVAITVLGLVVAGGSASGQEEAVEGIEFATSGTPGLDTIYLRGVGTDDADGLLLLEVWAHEVSDLYAVSFGLQFPGKLFKFPKGRSTVFVEGPFLAGDGAEETVLAVRQNGKEVIVGHTRTGEAPGASGSGLLMTLEFRGRGIAGTKKFRLRRSTAFDPSGEPIDGISWLAGKATVTVPEPSE